MKLGIKIAPGNDYKRDIESAHPQMVEVWYNASKPESYDELFAYLAGKKIDVGLHFWGVSDGLLADSSSPLVTRTIDVAAQNHFAYVNIHPDLYTALSVDFATMNIRVVGKPSDPKIRQQKFMDNVMRLNDYATSRNVVLTVETVPMRDTPSWNPYRDRTKALDIHQMPITVLADLSARGYFIANDLCHTACNIRSENSREVWDFLYKTSRVLAPQTRLVHLGFVVPPYNGVDYHDSLDNPILSTDTAVPNKKQMIELLQLFKNRDDMWILVEPKTDHANNYFLAREILQKAGVLTK